MRIVSMFYSQWDWVLRLIAALALLAGCSKSRDVQPEESQEKARNHSSTDDSSVLGMTVQEASHALHLTFGLHLVIEEPPEVARGIRGTDASGGEVWLYVDRIEDPDVRHWKLAAFDSMKVIGVARKVPSGWQTHGKVIWYYHSS